MKLPRLLKRHQPIGKGEGFEFKLPNLISLPGKKGRIILGAVVAGIIFLFLIYQVYRFLANLPIYNALDKPQQFTPKQVEKNVDLSTINNVIELPTDKNGLVVIIKDVDSLAKQKSFFKKARNGDVLIIYPELTIIYDRANHTVVDISKT